MAKTSWKVKPYSQHILRVMYIYIYIFILDITISFVIIQNQDFTIQHSDVTIKMSDLKSIDPSSASKNSSTQITDLPFGNLT